MGNSVTSQRFLSITVSVVSGIHPTLFFGILFLQEFYSLSFFILLTLVLKNTEWLFLVLNTVGLEEELMI